MKIYIILRDTASEFVPKIKIIGAFTTLDSALPTFKTEVNEARKLAMKKGYVIEKSVGNLSFESYQKGYASENHYNVSIQAVEMEELLEKGGVSYRKVRPTGEEGVINASFDVSFCPMVNVKIMVKDPHNLTEKEEEAIIEMAISEVRKNFSEKINGENLDSIKLYSIEDIEVN